MRIAFVWTGLTSYMADCWRRLAAEPGVELRVWIDVGGAAARAVDFAADELLRGVHHTLVNGCDGSAVARCADDVAVWRPDVIFAVGWRSPACRAVVGDRRLSEVPKICCFDMPWRWKPRCLVAPLVLGRFLRHYAAAFVPGAACARYAKWLGFRRVERGLFAIDIARFAPDRGTVPAQPRAKRYFLYLGRNAPEKRLDDLRAAHALYREQGGVLDLRLYGKDLENGFAAPVEVPALLRDAAAVVLASAFDPWPLVLLEAMAAGSPVIASDHCTNRAELGKNWRVFPCGDVKALAHALADAEADAASPRAEAAREENRSIAADYDCARWVRRVLACCRAPASETKS